MGGKEATQVEQLQAKHDRLVSFEVDGVLHAFRAPTEDEYEGVQEALAKKKKTVACREFAQILCVTDIGALKEAFKRYPALPLTLSDEFAELAGASIEITVKKG